MNLNYFQKVETYPADTLVPGRKDLNVLVEEKRTGSFNFGAGFSSIDNLLGFAEITQGNFDVTRWPYFTGGGQKFRLRVQLGTQRVEQSQRLRRQQGVTPWASHHSGRLVSRTEMSEPPVDTPS